MREGYQATSKTYLYASASTEAKRLASISKNAEVNVTGDGGKQGWYLASYNGQTGYVRAKYVKTASLMVFPYIETVAVSAPSGSAQNTQPTASGARILDGITANFRSAASAQASILAVLSAGTPVTVVSAAESGWYFCTVNGVNGYLHQSCLLLG